MTDEQLQRIRARLLEEREQVSATLRDHHAGRDLAEPIARDAAEKSELEVDRALEHRVALDESHLIQKIDFALERLDEGTYGSCEICGVSIPLERLLAKPSVSLCRSCQQSKENLSNVEESH
jgi:DnaK suppressor protein